jgi:hypothetical protein
VKSTSLIGHFLTRIFGILSEPSWQPTVVALNDANLVEAHQLIVFREADPILQGLRAKQIVDRSYDWMLCQEAIRIRCEELNAQFFKGKLQ